MPVRLGRRPAPERDRDDPPDSRRPSSRARPLWGAPERALDIGLEQHPPGGLVDLLERSAADLPRATARRRSTRACRSRRPPRQWRRKPRARRRDRRDPGSRTGILSPASSAEALPRRGPERVDASRPPRRRRGRRRARCPGPRPVTATRRVERSICMCRATGPECRRIAGGRPSSMSWISATSRVMAGVAMPAACASAAIHRDLRVDLGLALAHGEIAPDAGVGLGGVAVVLRHRGDGGAGGLPRKRPARRRRGRSR